MELVISRTFIDFISIVYLTYCFTLSHVHNGTYGREICFKSIKRSQSYHEKKISDHITRNCTIETLRRNITQYK